MNSPGGGDFIPTPPAELFKSSEVLDLPRSEMPVESSAAKAAESKGSEEPLAAEPTNSSDVVRTEESVSIFQPIAEEDPISPQTALGVKAFTILEPPMSASDVVPGTDSAFLLAFVVNDDLDGPDLKQSASAEVGALLGPNLDLPRSSTLPLECLDALEADQTEDDSMRAVFQPIPIDGDSEVSDLDTEVGSEILPNFDEISVDGRDYAAIVRELQKEADDFLEETESHFFSPVSLEKDDLKRRDTIWLIPLDDAPTGTLQCESSHDAIIVRPNHGDEPSGGLFNLVSAHGGRKESVPQVEVRAENLIAELKLNQGKEEDATSEEVPVSDSLNRSLAEKLEELEAGWLSKDVDCPDRDPATLRSMVRTASRGGPSHEVTTLVKLHILSVAKLLAGTPQVALDYLRYCVQNEQYQLALGDEAVVVFSSLSELILSELSSKEGGISTPKMTNGPMRTEKRIRTTVLVDAAAMCDNNDLRRVCNHLGENLSLVCLERDLGDAVSFEFDTTSACIFGSLPVDQGGPQATIAWASKTAKWLVMESAKYVGGVWIVLLLRNAGAPDAATRTAIRNLTSTIAMLVPPAPQTRLRLALDVNTAALLVRGAIDECADSNIDWYRERDQYPEVIQREMEPQIKLLRAFPSMTSVQAEQVVHTEAARDFLLRVAMNESESPIAPIVHACLLPSVPTVSQEPPRRVQIPLLNQSARPPRRYGGGRQESVPADVEDDDVALGDEVDTGSPVTPTPRTRRKRRLTLQRDSAGSTQTRLVWSYIE